MKETKTYLYILISLFLISCGGSSDEPKPSYKLEVNTDFVNYMFKHQSESLHLGLFKNKSDKQAIYSAPLQLDAKGMASASIASIEEGNYYTRVYLNINGVTRAVLHDFGMQQINADKTLNQSSINLISYARVQNQLFSTCVTCHGASSGDIASDMNLMPDLSYEQIVNVASKNSSKPRVKPGNADESFLYQVMKRENISFDHTGSPVSLEPELDLIKNWIELGAKKD